MDEYSTPVNDGQVSDESSQTQVETEQTVNADNAEATNGEQEQTAEGSKQTTDAQAEKAQETSTQSKEENAQFAKVRKEAEARVRAEIEQKQAARDTEFAKRAAQFGWVDGSGNPIKTEDAYWKAVDDQSKIDALVNQGKDPDAARAIIERDTLLAEREAEKAAFQSKAKQEAENAEFFSFYQEVNGKEFSPTDEIPTDVFRIAQEKGIPLKYAYAEHIAKAAIEKEKNIALGKQTAEANTKNATTSSGSVTGSPQSGTITESEISAHADDISWMNKNFKKVEEFYRKKG